MTRRPDPLGDPVRVQLRGRWLGVRYYPTGLITSPEDRVWLDDRWDPNDTVQVGHAHETADRLRKTLLEHRAAHGIVHSSTVGITVTVRASVDAFIASHSQETPSATIAARESRLAVSLVSKYGDRQVSELATFAKQVVTDVASAITKDGRPIAESTRSGRFDALNSFGAWLEQTYSMTNPFKGLTESMRGAGQSERKKALIRVHHTDPFADGDDNDAINPSDLPTYEQIIALRDAIFRRETTGPAERKQSGRGASGGAKTLAKDTAAQFAENVSFTAASGLRMCETLVVHTSRIRLEDLIVVVDRQLDRYKPWERGAEPPLVPPKFNKKRTVQIWPSYREKLTQLVAYADEFQGGWLFPPTRDQRYWAEGLTSAIDRAADLLTFERAQLEPEGADPTQACLWHHTYHWLRHFYTSQSLASTSAGGLGWSLPFVQRSLGHQSAATTERIYRHITDGEYLRARTVEHSWPGL